MKTLPPKLSDERIEIGLVDVQCVRDAYTRVMVKSWIILGTTGRVRSETYQLGWSLVTQIAYGNLHISNLMQRLF